ncbi:MAG: glycosyltransferase [Phycisphaerales bacterium JB039]
MAGTLFVFMGGGTGGHLFPGLAIAERLREAMGDRAEFLFLCSDRAVDREILSAERIGGAAVTFEALAAKPLSLRPRGLMRFAGSWGPSVRAARAFLRHAKGSEFERVRAVAMGGFVAAPAAQAARVERVDLTLVNLDAVPGKANRWIAKRAQRVLTAVDAGPAHWQRIGPIIRRGALAPGPAAQCRAQLGLDPEAPVLLVTGASQGARSLNELMMAMVGESEKRKAKSEKLAGESEERKAKSEKPGDARGVFASGGWQVLHQTGAQGEADLEAMRAAYASAGVRAIVQPFVREMGVWWGAAELALARAGAGIVAEVAANRVPTVFAPYPGHRDEHQRHNAQPLVEAGAAVIERDAGSARANLQGLGAALERLLQDAEARQRMRAALGRLGQADGAQQAAQVLMG